MSNTPESFFSQMPAALHENPGLIAALALCVVCPLVLTLVGFMQGSARPTLFVAGLTAPIILTFFIGQLVMARAPKAVTSPLPELEVREGQFACRAALFGPNVPAHLIREAKSGLPGILNDAQVAEVGMTLTGETTLVAQFASEEQAKLAAAAYQRGFQLRSISGDELNGWRAKRGLQGDCIEMLRTGRHLFVWSAATADACAARRAATNLAKNFPALVPTPKAALFPTLQPLGELFAPLWTKVAGLLLLVGLYSAWFFIGTAWTRT